MRILFFFSILDRLYARVAPRLRAVEPRLEFDGVLYGRYGRGNLLDGEFRGWRRLAVFSDYVRRHAHEPVDLGYLRAAEESCSPLNLNLVLAAERRSPEFGWRRSLKLLESALRFNSELLDEQPPDVILSEGIDCLLTYSLYLLAGERGIPFVLPAMGRLPGRFALIRNHLDRWERTEELYAAYQEDGAFPQEERRAAEHFLEAFRQERPRMLQVRRARPPGLRRRDLLSMARFTAARFDDPHDYSLESPARLLRRRVERVARSFVANLTMLAEEAEPADCYAFFPLHFEPEAATLVLAPFAMDQPSMVEYIAKSLPVGMRLYVKEHPMSVGRRPLGHYRRLATIPNVKLVSPWADTHALLRGCTLLTTITGTAGWEALLYERPVITFGNAFYNAYTPGVRHVSDLTRLPETVRELLERHRPDLERLLRFVAAALRTTYPGEIQHPTEIPESLDEANVALVADAYARELGLK